MSGALLLLLRMASAATLVLAVPSHAQSSSQRLQDSETARIDLSSFAASPSALEFSDQADYICGWWWPSTNAGDYTKLPGKVVVFGADGSYVSEATDTKGALQGKYIQMFPETAWRTYFADFVREAAGWGFARDYKVGFRMVDPQNQDGIREVSKGELWQLTPQRKLLWRVDLPPLIQHSRLRLVDFFSRDNRSFVVLSAGGKVGYILDGSDGKLLSAFPFGHIETDPEAIALKKKFNVSVDDGDVSLRFSSYTLAVDPSRRILACGAFYGRRVRVVSLDAPFVTTFEANTNDNPWAPEGGVWSVRSVRFAGGKYLIAEYDFAGRSTSRVEQPTDIFDLETKTRVWTENSLEIYAVRLSPDGRKIALINRGILEISEFRPRPIQ